VDIPRSVKPYLETGEEQARRMLVQLKSKQGERVRTVKSESAFHGAAETVPAPSSPKGAPLALPPLTRSLTTSLTQLNSTLSACTRLCPVLQRSKKLQTRRETIRRSPLTSSRSSRSLTTTTAPLALSSSGAHPLLPLYPFPHPRLSLTRRLSIQSRLARFRNLRPRDQHRWVERSWNAVRM
jgi:hypothetical protein